MSHAGCPVSTCGELWPLRWTLWLLLGGGARRGTPPTKEERWCPSGALLRHRCCDTQIRTLIGVFFLAQRVNCYVTRAVLLTKPSCWPSCLVGQAVMPAKLSNRPSYRKLIFKGGMLQHFNARAAHITLPSSRFSPLVFNVSVLIYSLIRSISLSMGAAVHCQNNCCQQLFRESLIRRQPGK